MNNMHFPYAVYDDRCLTRDVLAQLADKWALLILVRLELGPVPCGVILGHHPENIDSDTA